MDKRELLRNKVKQRPLPKCVTGTWSLKTLCRLYVSSLCIVAFAIAISSQDPARESFAVSLWRAISENAAAHDIFQSLEKNRVMLVFGRSNSRVARYRILSIVNYAAAKYGVDPALVRAIVRVESRGKHDAVSAKGARGLMQLMPDTARDFGVEDVFDPEQNIHGGTRYLRHLLDTFGNDMKLALAAYNAGPEKVRHYNGVPPFRETQNYVNKVMSIYRG